MDALVALPAPSAIALAAAPASAAPAAPPATAAPYVYAPGDIYPRTPREKELCDRASSPDWIYLAGIVAIDVGAFWLGSSNHVKLADSLAVRLSGPAMIGFAWGATIGGAWLALPKCSPTWVDQAPREGDVRSVWPLALSIALLAGATAPIVNGIAIGNLPQSWSTPERQGHLVTAGVIGFGSALLPYLLPPATYSAARELERIRVAPVTSAAASGQPISGAYVSYSVPF
jgi:hypothetical protein